MSDHTPTIAAGAPHPPHVQAFVDLANCLLGVIGAASPDAGSSAGRVRSARTANVTAVTRAAETLTIVQ